MTSVSGSGERILAILDLFSEDCPNWTTEQMMEALGYSRPTLYRYLKTLKDAGFLASLPNYGYTLGPRVTELDFLMRRSDPLIAESRPHLDRLARRHGAAVFVVRWYRRKLLCVASEDHSHEPRSSYPRGRPMPLGRGAISRAIAAFLPSRERNALIEEYLDEFTTLGIGTTREAVLNELKQVRREGVAVAWGEVTPGLIGIASPILAPDASPIGAICLSKEARGTDDSELSVIKDAILTASLEISGRLDPETKRQIA
jgi:DNA-binding IclR family transcriptional regulator